MIEAQLEWDGVVLPLESPTWENVLSAARRLQGLEISEDFFLTYKDDEGDVINVKNAIDLAEAVRWAEEQKVACLCLRIPFSSSDSDDESWTEINDGLAQQQMDGSLSRQVTEETENGTIRRSPSPSAEEVILEHEPGSAKSPEVANETREDPSSAIPREVVAAEVLSGEREAEASSETESDSETELAPHVIEESSEKSEEPAPVAEQTPEVVLTPINEVFAASSLLSEKEVAPSLNPEKVIELLYRAAQGDLIQGKSPREFLLTLLSSSEALEALKQVINVPAVTAAINQVVNSERLTPGVAQKAATTELIRLMYRDSEFLDVLNKVPDVDQLILYLFASLREAAPSTPAEVAPSAATRVPKVVHRDVECDGCAVDSELRSQSILEGFRNDSGEICGFRYKSAVLPNYDLCEVCERDGRFEEKAGPFLKIRDKTQVPEVILCIMPGATQEAMQRSASVDWHNPVAQEFFEFLRERHEPNPTNSPSDTPVSEQSATPNLGEQASQPSAAPISSEESDDLRCKHMLTRFETPHGNFRCDMCSRKVPARTVLYGCRTCNFDLCTDCRSARSDVIGAVPTVNVASASPIAAAPLPVAPRSLPPQAKFVCDVTLADGSTVRQNERLIKVWRVRNAGSEAWPEGTRIAHVGGDPFGGPMEGVQVPLAAPGAIVDISVPLVMPSVPGRYTSYWRLMTPYPQSAKFGHRFWVTVNVVPGVPRPAPPPPMPAEPVVTLPVVDLRSSGLVGSPAVLNLNNVPPPPPMVDPGIPDEYVESVSKIVDFGFTDLDKIVQVLSSVNGNVAEAIERLLEA